MSILVALILIAFGAWEYVKFEEPIGGIWTTLGLTILALSGP